jgi:uncharacterized OB-fold protein
MSTLQPQPLGVPVPTTSTRAAPYWEACRRHELVYQRCAACGYVGPRPFIVCARCQGTETTWEPSAGRGTLYSWTVVWRPQRPAFQVPYAPAIVALDEGVRMTSAVIGCEVEDLAPDLPLEVEFHPVSDDLTLPYFRPRHDEGSGR